MRIHFLTLTLLVASCTGTVETAETDDPDTDPDTDPIATDFGGTELGLDEDCGGIVGLTGQAVLDRQTAGYTSTLNYVTADAQFVDPTALTVALTWPAAPIATCYPAWDETPLYAAEDRVGIHGLTLSLSTADGHFTETLDATAWLTVLSGTPVQTSVTGVRRYGALDGDWVPFAEYGDGTGATLDFQVVLAQNPSAIQGSVGMGTIPLDRMEAGVFGSRFAVATWPHMGR